MARISTSFHIMTATALCAAAIALSAPAQAVPLTLTLDNANQTVAIPTTGSVTLDFTGTFTTTGNYIPSGAGIFTPFLLNSGTGVFPTFGPHIGESAYSGVDQTLFSVQIDSTTAPGLYAYQFSSSSPALFSFDAYDGQNNAFVQLPFSILVVNSLSTPEPSTYAAFAFGVFGLGMLMLKARKRSLSM